MFLKYACVSGLTWKIKQRALNVERGAAISMTSVWQQFYIQE